MRLAPMLRSDARWYRMQILHWIAVLLLAGCTFVWCQLWLVATAWLAFALLIALPGALARRAASLSAQARWAPAAQWMHGAGVLTGGGLGKLYRGYAKAMAEIH